MFIIDGEKTNIVKKDDSMNSNLLFSIVIPVYMAESFLEKCINSILTQSYSQFEIILVDDGSTDTSPEMCDKFSINDKRVKTLHQKNKGVVAARKAGIDTAKGEYIICIDADDWLKQGLLSEAANVIADKHPDIIYYGIIFEQNISEDCFPCRKGYYTKQEIEKEIFPILIHSPSAVYFPPSVCGEIINRNLFKANLITNIKATIGEDGACLIPCLYYAKSFFAIEERYYYYRYNKFSATKGHKAFSLDCPRIVNEHIISKIDLNTYDFQEQIYRKIVHDFFYTAFTQFYQSKNYKEIKSEILKNMQTEPYKTAIEKAKFEKSVKAKFMIVSLRHQWIFLIYLYSILKKCI